ncbi:NADH-quinone oxidoreductase subunit N, partial [Candidatus Liberibacter asiaticus]
LRLGKYFLLISAVKREFYVLAIVALLSSVISAYYYLRVISIMWFDQSTECVVVVAKEMRLFILGSILFVTGYFLIENILNS